MPGPTRVGVLGFSAGGHAAAMAALAPGAAPTERIDLVILGYPVVSMLLPTHAGSQREPARTGAVRRRCAPRPPPICSSRRDAPPFFIWHTAEDTVVPVQHSYLLGMALAAAGVPHELHVYERGRHGIGFGEGTGTAPAWRAASAAWLRQRGWGS